MRDGFSYQGDTTKDAEFDPFGADVDGEAADIPF
jgi:hypothetical protein